MGCCESSDSSFSPAPAPAPPSTNPPEPDFSDFTWVPSSPYQGIPGNAVLAGNDQDGMWYPSEVTFCISIKCNFVQVLPFTWVELDMLEI